MGMVTFIFRCLLSLLLCYASFVSVYITFFKEKSYSDPTAWLFVVTLLVFSVISIKQIRLHIRSGEIKKIFNLYRSPLNFPDYTERRKPGNSNKIGINKKSVAIAALCLLSFFSGFFNVWTQYSRESGETELHQFFRSYSHKAMPASYTQQQPPLDYYFSSFSGKLFGESKFAIRFHSMLFYLILSLILPLGLWFFCSSVWITAVGTVLFLLNGLISLRAAEGRPLCLALLTGFLFLFFYLSAVCKTGRFSQQRLFPILASQYLFVMSVGLQPVIFIISLFVSSFWLFPDKKDIFKKLFLSNMITAVLTLPFYIKMWSFAQSAGKFRKVSFESLLNYMMDMNINYFLKKYFFKFYGEMLFSFLLLSAALIVSLFIKRTLKKQTLMIISGLIIFPLLYNLVFKTGVSWNFFSNRYIIVYSLFFILFAVLSLKEIDIALTTVSRTPFQGKNGKLNGKISSFVRNLKTGFLITAAALFLWNVWFQISFVKNKTRSYQNNEMEKIYDFLKNKGGPEDVAIEIALTPVLFPRLKTQVHYRKRLLHDLDRHPVIIESYLHYYKTPPFFHEATGDVIYHIDWEEIPKKSGQKIFFVVSTERDNDKAYQSLSNFMAGRTIGKSVVFEWTLPGKNRKEEYKSLLSAINRRTPEKYRGAIYETLLHYAYKDRNRVEFDRLLTEYKNMETALDEILSKYGYPSRFELRRRVNYFENLDFNKNPEESS